MMLIACEIGCTSRQTLDQAHTLGIRIEILELKELIERDIDENANVTFTPI